MTMTATRAEGGQPVGDPLRMFIGGERAEALSGRTFDSIDPFTGEAWVQVPEASAADVDRAVAAARPSRWAESLGVGRACAQHCRCLCSKNHHLN